MKGKHARFMGVTMVSVSAGSRNVLMSGPRLLFGGVIVFSLIVNLFGAVAALGGGLNPPTAGSASVPFGSPATIGTTATVQSNGFPSERSFHVEDQTALGATDRGSLTPDQEGSLITAQQLTRRIFERERRWTDDIEKDIERTRRRLSPPQLETPQLETPQRVRQLRRRVLETEGAGEIKEGTPRGPIRRLISHRLFGGAEMGVGSAFREQVWTNPRQTLKTLSGALTDARKLRDRTAELSALGGLGKANFVLGRFPIAEDYFRQAFELEKERQNVDGEAGALVHIAGARNAAGRTRAALDASRQALERFRQTKNRTGEALTLNNMGMTFRNQDDYRNAVESLQNALQADDTQDEARTLRLMNLAGIHMAYANYEPAKKSLKEALEIQKKTGDVKGQALTLMSLSEVVLSEGLGEKAVEPLTEALEVLNKAKQPSNHVKKRIGDLWLSLGQTDKARSFIEESGSEASLGRYYLATNALPKAERHFRKVLQSSRELSSPDDAFVGTTGLGLVAEGRGDLRTAERLFENSVKAVEEMRAGLLPAERKNFYAAVLEGFPRAEAAKGLVRVRMKLKRPEQTIMVGEITRAREFTDNICRRTDITNLKVPQEILDKDAELQNVVASLEKARDVMPRQKDPERYEAVSADLNKARAELKTFVTMLWEQYRHYAAARHPRPVDLKDAAIGKDEHVITFDVFREGVGIKLLRAKRVVKAVYVQLKSEELEKDIREFRRPLETVKLRDFNVELAAKLYNRLLAPVVADLPKGTSITLIPDGVLALLPFEALVVKGTPEWKKAAWGEYPSGLEYVGDVYPIVYYQSLTALTLTRELAPKTTGERLLVVADPVFQMQDARAAGAKEIKIAKEQQEFVVSLMSAVQAVDGAPFKLQRLTETTELANFLQKLYSGETDLLTGLQANKEAFMTKVGPEIAKYGKLVLATHGLASNTLPGMMEPALALSMVPQGTDGFLTMTEVMGLNANADVVALTACQTGLGKILPGEGVMSMGRAFQAAGAKTVLMSLWSVSETGSVKLMEIFFTHLKSGLPKLQAWSLARKDLRSQGYDHPFFWAPFILVGGSN